MHKLIVHGRCMRDEIRCRGDSLSDVLNGDIVRVIMSTCIVLTQPTTITTGRREEEGMCARKYAMLGQHLLWRCCICAKIMRM